MIALAAFATLAKAVWSSALMRQPAAAPVSASVREIGQTLMKDYVLPLEAVALLLTAAMIGAVIIAMHEKQK